MKLLYRSYFSIGGEIVVINQEKWKEDSSSSSGFLSISRTNAVFISIHSDSLLANSTIIWWSSPQDLLKFPLVDLSPDEISVNNNSIRL